jgi:hypothetical protein
MPLGFSVILATTGSIGLITGIFMVLFGDEITIHEYDWRSRNPAALLFACLAVIVYVIYIAVCQMFVIGSLWLIFFMFLNDPCGLNEVVSVVVAPAAFMAFMALFGVFGFFLED